MQSKFYNCMAKTALFCATLLSYFSYFSFNVFVPESAQFEWAVASGFSLLDET